MLLALLLGGVTVTLAPEATRTQRERVTILLHKPVGYVSGQPEPGYAPAVSLIGPDNQFDRDSAQRFHPSQLKNLAPAGRLDIDSTGLLVLTQDGRVARQLIGDDSSIDKEYLVRVEGRLAENGLALLNHGLWLDDRPLRPAQVEWVNDDQLRFVLREGRKRQIRRNRSSRNPWVTNTCTAVIVDSASAPQSNARLGSPSKSVWT